MKSNLLRVLTIGAVLVLALIIVFPVYAQNDTPPKIESFDYLAQMIIAVTTAAVVYGLKSFFQLTKIDLTGRGTALTATAVALLFEAINSGLSGIPPQYYAATISFLGFLTAVLTAFGISHVIKKFTAPPENLGDGTGTRKPVILPADKR
jgi:FtsH-binding integral membrane protein